MTSHCCCLAKQRFFDLTPQGCISGLETSGYVGVFRVGVWLARLSSRVPYGSKKAWMLSQERTLGLTRRIRLDPRQIRTDPFRIRTDVPSDLMNNHESCTGA